MNRTWLVMGLLLAACACDGSASNKDKTTGEEGAADSTGSAAKTKKKKIDKAETDDGSIPAPKRGEEPKAMVGGWAKYDVTSPGGGGTAMWQLVERRNQSEWLMDAVVDFKQKIGVQAWLDAPGWDKDWKQYKAANVTELRVQMPGGAIQSYRGAQMTAIRKVIGDFMTGYMPPKFDSLPQEDMTVKAGTFRGCYRWTSTTTLMGQTAESTIWTHPAVPPPAMVKSVAKDGSSYELTAYGKTGAKRSF